MGLLNLRQNLIIQLAGYNNYFMIIYLFIYFANQQGREKNCTLQSYIKQSVYSANRRVLIHRTCSRVLGDSKKPYLRPRKIFGRYELILNPLGHLPKGYSIMTFFPVRVQGEFWGIIGGFVWVGTFSNSQNILGLFPRHTGIPGSLGIDNSPTKDSLGIRKRAHFQKQHFFSLEIPLPLLRNLTYSQEINVILRNYDSGINYSNYFPWNLHLQKAY